jgi:hypothetical protein
MASMKADRKAGFQSMLAASRTASFQRSVWPWPAALSAE